MKVSIFSAEWNRQLDVLNKSPLNKAALSQLQEPDHNRLYSAQLTVQSIRNGEVTTPDRGRLSDILTNAESLLDLEPNKAQTWINPATWTNDAELGPQLVMELEANLVEEGLLFSPSTEG